MKEIQIHTMINGWILFRDVPNALISYTKGVIFPRPFFVKISRVYLVFSVGNTIN